MLSRRTSTSSTRRRPARASSTIDLPSDRVLTRSRYPNAAAVPHLVRPLAGRRPARRDDARRDLLGAGQEGRHAADHARERGARELGHLRPDGQAPGLRHRRAARGGDPHHRRLGPRRAEGTIKPAEPERLALPAGLSPDGKWIAYADQTQTLYVVPAAGRRPRKVDRSRRKREITRLRVEPRRPLARLHEAGPRTDYSSIYDLRHVERNDVHRITGGDTDDDLAGLGSRRALPVLPERPRHEPAARRRATSRTSRSSRRSSTWSCCARTARTRSRRRPGCLRTTRRSKKDDAKAATKRRTKPEEDKDEEGRQGRTGEADRDRLRRARRSRSSSCPSRPASTAT